jgi:hypothetical protein
MRPREEAGDGKTKRRDICPTSDVFARKASAEEEAGSWGGDLAFCYGKPVLNKL